MVVRVPDQCPGCGLILLWGCVSSAFEKEDMYGPILGLSKKARAETAKAGYVGISSLWVQEWMQRPQWRMWYRCPRCRCDPLVEDVNAPSGALP